MTRRINDYWDARAVYSYSTPTTLASQRGPTKEPRYAMVISLGSLFKWDNTSTATADSVTVIAPTGSAAGRWLRVGSTEPIPATTSTTNITITIGQIAFVDPTSGPIAVTLPSAIDVAGQGVGIKNDSGSANTITLTPVLSQTIDGAATATINTGRGSISLRSNGANWVVYPV